MTFKMVKSDYGFADIYIASPYDESVMFMRKYCDVGFCVNVSKCDYVYTYGMECGVKIGLINYPRFPKSQEELTEIAIDIGLKLSESTSQGSFTIVTPDGNCFYSRRGDLE